MTTSNQNLQIFAFGGVNASFADGTTVRLQTNRARALLLYLVLHRGRFVHREEICAALWPDAAEREGRAQLRKSLWRVRSALRHGEQPDVELLRCTEGHIGLETDLIWADIWEFDDALTNLDVQRSDIGMAERVARMIHAIDLQSGTFAAGIFDAWCIERQRSHDQARITAIERIVDYYSNQEQWVQAIHWAQRGLRFDPMVEHLHRVIMACHMSMGDRASALRQYLDCEDALKKGLAIAPSDRTQAIARQIAGPGAAPAPEESNTFENTTDAGSLTALRCRLEHHSNRMRTAAGSMMPVETRRKTQAVS